MDDYFYQAFFPPDVRICGIVLPPFTLWSRTCLEAIRSPLLEGTVDFSPADLLIAVRICQARWPNRPDLKVRLADLLRKRWLERNEIAFVRASRVFIKYMRGCSSYPKFWTCVGDERRSLTAPPVLSCVTGLMSNGFSLGEAWNATPGEARWHLAALAEREGAEDEFLWEDELEDVEMEDLSAVDETTLYEMAVRDLGPEDARRWAAVRRKNRSNR